MHFIMKNLLLAITLLSSIANTQIVTVPDANFRAALIYKYDFNNDNQIQNTEVDTVTKLSVTGLSISDLTGIEAFTNLQNLWCGNNQLSTINLAMNSNLIRLTCGNNQITTLNLSANPALTYLDCPQNQLTNLNLTTNTALYDVICSGNQLSTLSLGSNITLGALDAGGNNLTTINLSQNTGLTFLRIWDNHLTSLDVRSNTILNYFACNNNPNLTQICVNSNQYFNLTSAWSKDASAYWNNNCITASIDELYQSSSIGIITHIYNLIGEEVTLQQTKEKEGVYIYHYSSGLVKKQANYK
jgi:hypothetical protein